MNKKLFNFNTGHISIWNAADDQAIGTFCCTFSIEWIFETNGGVYIQCISTVRLLIINGSLLEFFAASVNPPLPVLFLLVVEALNKLFEQVIYEREIKPFVCRQCLHSL